MSHFHQYRKEFYEDAHIPDLLAFHPSISFQTEPLYLNGLLILQDKASCLPAALLSPPQSDKTIVIDATAAPGNKTSHLSSLMGNKGKVRGKNISLCAFLTNPFDLNPI
jgi:25S rRNA (cytosine2278-C5)-methyltransferase